MGNTAEKEEIIIRCSAQEMVKNFVKDYQIIWHDPNVHSPENSQYITQFNSFCEVKPFTDWKSAADYTNKADTSCHLITSGTNGELLVKEIHAAKNVSKIYVFCGNKAFHQTWASQYPKIICVENDIKKLVVQIELNMLEWQRQTSSLRVGLPAFAPIFDDMDKSEMNYLHLNLKGLSNFKNRAQAKEDFLSLSKVIFPDKVNITEFQNSYNKYDMKQILKWYTKESFLYKVTNNCLRIATSDAIQYCRLILKDLETAIRQQYQVKSKRFSGLLYRGAYISEREWSNLVANIGKDIEMYGFLSTSKNKVRAEEFVMTDFDRKVLITIIVPQGPDKGEQGFAEVHEFSHFPLEQEVLFNVRSRFTILEADVEKIAERSVRHLVLFYGAQEWRKNNLLMKPVLKIRLNPLKLNNITCQACKGKISEGAYFISLVAEMKGYTCHKCLVEGYIQINKGPFLYINPTATGTGENVIEENGQKVLVVKGSVMKYPMELDIPLYGYKCKGCKETKQKWYYKCVECEKTLWCEKCFKGGEDCAENGHNIVLEGRPFGFWCEQMTEKEYQHISFQEGMIEKDGAFEQADIFFKSNQYEKAIQYYNKVIENTSKDEKKKDNLAMTYGNLGLVYSNLGRYEEALENLFKSLEITRKISKKNNPDMALCYNNIGLVYDSMKNHEEGLKFYFMSLELYKEIYGDNSQDIAMLYNNIGLVYDGLEKYEEALEYHNKSIEIKIELYGENDVSVATSYNNIGLAYDNMGKEEEALENYFKSLEIKKAVYGEKHADIAMLYNNIGLVYKGMRKYNKALSHSLKSLEIKMLIYGENHPDTALAYNNIGLVYEGQGKYEEGLTNFLKYLEITRANLGENHQNIAKAYQMIGRMLRELGRYEESLENLKKSLEIKKSIFGEKDASVIQMKKNIEQVNAKMLQSLQKNKKKNKTNKVIITSGDSSPLKDASPLKKDKESPSPISDKNNENNSPY